MRKRFPCALLAVLLAAPAVAAEPLVFAYFKDPATSVYFALSRDGYHWQTLNAGQPWLPAQQPGELMRDPFVTRGPDGEFHMVWTWAWRGTSLGYAHSKDLIHWSAQRQIPINTLPGAQTTWAPEVYWDDSKSDWLLIWSSAVEGRDGPRVYSATTRDFQTFTKPELFFDPGFQTIDATILHTRGKFYLVFKDERQEPVKKWVQIAESDSLTGPYSHISEPITESWSEGPSAVDLGGQYVVYYDHYHDPKRYEAVRSTDLVHWTSATADMDLPRGARHGSFLKVTPEEAAELEGAVTAAAPIRIILVGDSTMAVKSGYGTGFCADVTPEVTCLNLAKGGRSTSSYRAEGSWDEVLAELRRGHYAATYVLIQFGHNDQPGKPGRSTDLATEFPANLRRYVEEVKAAGAKPVLVTSLTRRIFRQGKLTDTLQPWADATRQIADETHVPLLDLHAESMAAVDKMGPAEANSLAMAPVPPEIAADPENSPNAPKTPAEPGAAVFDYTHLGPKGAEYFGLMVAHELAAAIPALRPYLKL
jgi:lysophospholipase L1-like esterase